VTPLQRAFALAEVDDLAEPVAEDLDLDVAGLGEVLLQVERSVCEGALGLVGGEAEGGGELLAVSSHPHPAAAAPCDRLEKDRIADPVGDLQSLVGRLDRAGAARNGRDARLLRGVPRNRLVAHLPDRFGRGTDPGQADLPEGAGEGGVLGQEPVARVHRVGARDLGGCDERGDVQIRARGSRGTYADRLVGGLDVEGVPVDRRMNGHRRHTQLLAGRDDPEGDLPTVRDEDLAKHQAGRIAKSFSPNSTGWPFFGKTSTIVPATSASISFISFIASTIQSVAPFSTESPTDTNESASGFGDR
jgi:hypothetical protein